MTDSKPRPKVFLSYATEDKTFAERIAKALEARGVSVWYDRPVHVDSSLLQRISEVISASDYLLVLISSHMKRSDRLMHELATGVKKELTARDITILPVLIADVEMPGFLQSYQYFDCRTNTERRIERLIDQISAAPEIDFGRLTPQLFESLVADLLIRADFTNVVRTAAFKDVGYDFKADFQRKDPFGVDSTETWLVECKFYRQSRADLKSISQFLVRLSLLESNNRGLLITNSQLTSVALEHLAVLRSKTGKDLRVIAGPELKRLLIRHEDLVTKYFRDNPPDSHESSS
jgi:hypothetical protein